MKIFGMNLHPGELLKEGIYSLGIHTFLEKNGEKFAEVVVKRVTDDVRSKLFAYIRGLGDSVAIQGLMTRYQEAKSLGLDHEDKFVNILARLYLAVKDDPKKKWVFRDLGRMSKAEFEDALTFLENDVIAQWFKKARHILGDAFKSIADTATAWGRKMVELAERLDDKLEPVADRVEALRRRREREWFQ
jgi:hypothetical protein